MRPHPPLNMPCCQVDVVSHTHSVLEWGKGGGHDILITLYQCISIVAFDSAESIKNGILTLKRAEKGAQGGSKPIAQLH